MAVTMTRVGKLPEEKMYVGRCSKCSSEYRAQRKDLDIDSDFRETTYTARCQLTGCNTLVYFAQERSR